MRIAEHLSAWGRRLLLSLLLSMAAAAWLAGGTNPEDKYRSAVIVAVTSGSDASGGDSAVNAAASTAASAVNIPELIISVEGGGAIPYQVRINQNRFGVTLERDGQTVLASAGGDHITPAFSAVRNGKTNVISGMVLYDTYNGEQLTLLAAASDGGEPFKITIMPLGDRIDWQVRLPGAEQITLHLDVASGGHWYGHGEGGNDTGLWPLNDAATTIHAADFSPASYNMDEPFWFTSRGTGLWIDTPAAMVVSMDGTTAGTNRADFTVKSGEPLHAVTFIERSPRDVYYDYVDIAGKPRKSDAPAEQYTEPVWNTWAMYGKEVTQADVIRYAQNIREAGLGGYAIQIDDRWSSKYGDFTFDAEKFPDPTAMSRQIHEMGFDLGLWVTLWVNLDAQNYTVARDAGYLLRSAADPTQPCTVRWWHGEAGIIDLGNPEAAKWLREQLRQLERTHNVQGFKFDTRVFDPVCAPAEGRTMRDYQRLGAEFADQFNLQGVGIRLHWTGQQQYGFITRAVDAHPDFGPMGLGRSVRQALTLSVLGYPFVVTDMVGGSAGGNPTDEVLVRWAQASVALPAWYGSTSPAGPFTLTREYAPTTTELYRAALDQHRALAPYIRKQVRRAVAEGEPVVKPLFFNYPNEAETYTIADQWLLGDAVLSAPVLTSAETRDIYLPAGTWHDVNTGVRLTGPQVIKDYPAPLAVLPLFLNLEDPEGEALAAVFEALATPAPAP